MARGLSKLNQRPRLDKLLALGIIELSPDWHTRRMGRADADKAGDPLPGQEPHIDDRGDLRYALILDRVGTAVTQAAHVDKLASCIVAASSRKGRMTLSK